MRELAPAEPMRPVCDPAGWHSAEITSFGGGRIAFTEGESRAMLATGAAGTADLGEATMRVARLVAELHDGLGFAIVTGLGAGAARLLATQLSATDIACVVPTDDQVGTVTSLVTVYNYMLARQPDLLHDALDAGSLFVIDKGRLSAAPVHNERDPLLTAAANLHESLVAELGHPIALAPTEVLVWNARVVRPALILA
ncbi:MAG: hypothetical protein WAL22_23415 [Solirubrobacteraceae bacterium]